MGEWVGGWLVGCVRGRMREQAISSNDIFLERIQKNEKKHLFFAPEDDFY